MNPFYEVIINTKIELSKAFEKYSNEFTTEQWQVLQDSFHQQLETDYPTIRREINDEVVEEKNPIPNNISKRIKVAAMLLNILALGGKYNRNLYLKTLDFCTTADVKNGSFA